MAARFVPADHGQSVGRIGNAVRGGRAVSGDAGPAARPSALVPSGGRAGCPTPKNPSTVLVPVVEEKEEVAKEEGAAVRVAPRPLERPSRLHLSRLRKFAASSCVPCVRSGRALTAARRF